MQNNTLLKTNFSFPKQTSFYRGKVRDVYVIADRIFVMIATDRISAFDTVLPQGIPYKGQVLNQIANFFLDMTKDIVPNWKIISPDPMATVGKKCVPLPVEIIVRAYLVGSAWRAYKDGKRTISGVPIPDGMREFQAFSEPIITPTTKATTGHDEEISAQEIVETGLVDKKTYEKIEQYALELFYKGTEYAKKRGLILVDTKYEFGIYNGEPILIDEVHTPDSSRYFYLDDYNKKFSKYEKPRQLSKEFIRQWLISQGFMGQKGQKLPQIPQQVINEVSNRYLELYKILIGEELKKQNTQDIQNRIFNNVNKTLQEVL